MRAIRRHRRWLLVASAVVLAGLAVATALASGAGAASPHAGRVRTFDVLKPNGIAGVRFGASPRRLRTEIDSLLGQAGGAYRGGASLCGLDHAITWRTAYGQTLVVDFGHARFVGYQFGTLERPRRPSGGWALATARGLRVGDTLAQGRRLYGPAFSLSAAQGGSWNLRTAHGPIVGYAWGVPKGGGDVGWQSVVATIDAGNVGCAAMTP